jgi:hypothetical protein
MNELMHDYVCYVYDHVYEYVRVITYMIKLRARALDATRQV